jgi:hypothetical protein
VPVTEGLACRPEKKVSYAELTKGQRIERRWQQKAVLEAVSEFTIVGKPTLGQDALAKVTGKAQYAGDIRVPGMLCAAIPPLEPHAALAQIKGDKVTVWASTQNPFRAREPLPGNRRST